MSLTPELVISVVIQLISVGIMLGVYKTTIAFMQQQIQELKQDMHKYNNVLTRLALAENKIESAHQRIDNIVKL